MNLISQKTIYEGVGNGILRRKWHKNFVGEKLKELYLWYYYIHFFVKAWGIISYYHIDNSK